MNYYKFHIGDYRKDTSHLTNEEHFIYRHLIDWYYLDESPIPNDNQTITRRLKLKSDWLQYLTNVLNDFFEETESGYIHRRIEHEIKEYSAMCDTHRVSGKLGGRPRKKPLVIDKNQTITKKNPNHEPLTINQEPLKHKNSRNNKVPVPPGFGITPDLIEWAKSKSVSETKLNEHMENFINQSLARDYRYVDWNAAFRNAVKSNWAKLPEKREPKKFIFE